MRCVTLHCSGGGEIPTHQLKHAEAVYDEILDWLMTKAGNARKTVTVAQEMKRFLDGKSLDEQGGPA